MPVHDDLRRERRLRPVPERREHLTGLTVIVVDRLLAEQHQIRLLALDERAQRACGTERLERSRALDQYRAVGTHRERSAKLLLRIGAPDRDREHLAGRAALLEPEGFLERDLVEWVDAHLQAFGRDARSVRLHANADVVVHDALDTNHHLLQPRLRSRREFAGILAAASRGCPLTLP